MLSCNRDAPGMRWDGLTRTAFARIAALVASAGPLWDEAGGSVVPVVGMVAGIAALAFASLERLKLSVAALENALLKRSGGGSKEPEARGSGSARAPRLPPRTARQPGGCVGLKIQRNGRGTTTTSETKVAAA